MREIQCFYRHHEDPLKVSLTVSFLAPRVAVVLVVTRHLQSHFLLLVRRHNCKDIFRTLKQKTLKVELLVNPIQVLLCLQLELSCCCHQLKEMRVCVGVGVGVWVCVWVCVCGCVCVCECVGGCGCVGVGVCVSILLGVSCCFAENQMENTKMKK